MQKIRLWHQYLSLFTAPSILFFALTGATQLFGLHESRGDYHAPAILEKLSALHKDQVFELKHHQAPPQMAVDEPKPPAAGAGDEHEDDFNLSAALLKFFFLVTSLSLSVSAIFGIYIGVSHAKRKRLSWVLLAAGAALPILMVLI